MRRTATLAVLALGVLAAAGASAQPPSPPAAGIVARVQAFYEGTTDFKAAFRQVVRTRSPKRTFTRSGTVYFKRPGLMRWDYKVPDEVYYVSDGDVLWSYDVEEGIAYRLRVKDSDLYRALQFLTGAADLTREFDAAEGRPTTPGLVPLKLTPRTPGQAFRSVTLFVDPASGETRETEVEDPLGNESHIWFESPSYKPLPRDGFSFRPPEGVRVQDVGSK